MYIDLLTLKEVQNRLFIEDYDLYPHIYNEKDLIIYKTVPIVYNHDDVHEKFYKIKFKNINTRYLHTTNITRLHGTYFISAFSESKNYSHYTLQVLASLLFAKKLQIINKNIKILIDKSKNFQNEILSLFFDKDNFDFIQIDNSKTYKIENCYYVSPMLLPSYHEDIVSYFEEIGKKFIKGKANFYVSRLDTTFRPLENEYEIIDYFRKKLFDIYTFSNITVKKQIELFASARTICSAHGASGVNLLYSQKDFHFIEIFPENKITSFHIKILTHKNCYYSPIMGNTNQTYSIKDSTFTVDIQLIDKALITPVHTFTKNKSEIISVEKSPHNFISQYLSDIDKLILDSINLEKRGHIKASLSSLQSALKDEPFNIRILKYTFDFLMRNKLMSELASIISQKIEKFVDWDDIYIYQSLIYDHYSDKINAVRAALKAMELSPYKKEPTKNYLNILLKYNKINELTEILPNIITRFQNWGEPYSILSSIYERQEDICLAIDMAKISIDIEPENIGRYYLAFQLFSKYNIHHELDYFINVAINKFPYWSYPYIQKSIFFEKSGNICNAINMAKKAISIEPDNKSRHNHLHQLYKKYNINAHAVKGGVSKPKPIVRP